MAITTPPQVHCNHLPLIFLFAVSKGVGHHAMMIDESCFPTKALLNDQIVGGRHARTN
jgi:hypothetical protein